MNILKKIWAIFTISLILGLTITSYVCATNPITSNEDEKEHWVVIICGGVKKDPQKLDVAFRRNTKHAYETFKKLGYDDDHIYFLQGKNLSDDGGDLPEGVDGFSNKTNAKYAITCWLVENMDDNDDCFIFLTDHGHFSLRQRDSFISIYDYECDKQEYICGHELAEWLDQVNYGVCTIMIAACQAYGFIRQLSKENRIIITPTKREIGAVPITGSFASFFFDKVGENASYGHAWEYAGKRVLRMKMRDLPAEDPLFIKILTKIIFLVQNPQIDDNGDGKGSGYRLIAEKLPIGKDGFLALNTYPS